MGLGLLYHYELLWSLILPSFGLGLVKWVTVAGIPHKMSKLPSRQVMEQKEPDKSCGLGLDLGS